MSKRSRRWLLGILVVFLLLAIFLGRPAFHLARAWLGDKDETTPPPAGFVDDASRLNETEVAEVWDIPGDIDQAEQQLKDLLQRAREKGLPVAIAGSKHTQGGHTISPKGIVVNMLPFNHMHLEEGTKMLKVGAGARWAEILPYLDKQGCSVAIMQSNNTFSVGGSISANCHGWQHNHPPIASTVLAFRLMKADGTIVGCSRTENAELFKAVLGGYGLFGIILDVDLQAVPNERYRLETFIVPKGKYITTFENKVSGANDVGMAYGRLSIVSGEDFLGEAILNVFRKAPCSREEIPGLSKPGLIPLRRAIFRGSVNSDYGKRLRWKAEKLLGPKLAKEFYSRNQLLNEGVEIFQEHSAKRTDILHEYFIPPGRFNDFLEKMRVVIPRHKGDLLNVTVRNVLKDKDTLLRYADQDLFGLVMLFSQERTKEADARMEAMTQEMIDAALDLGGRYYLPYRLHATREQFQRAYPKASQFFAAKRRYDPQELFQNLFYLKYGRQ